MAELDTILSAAVTGNASDVYLIEGTPPTLKIDGVAAPLAGVAPLSRLDLQKLLITRDQALLKLYQGKKITQEAALQFADSPNNLRLRIKGIK